MNEKKDLTTLVRALLASVGEQGVTTDHLWLALRNALDPPRLIDNLSEALRMSARDTEQFLKDHGFGDLVTQARIARKERAPQRAEAALTIFTEPLRSPFPELFSIVTAPSADEPVLLSPDVKQAFAELVEGVVGSTAFDPFAELYRGHVPEYYESFMATDAPAISQYIAASFGDGGPRYMANSGIGANEQFNHFVARISNASPQRKCNWLITNSPRQLSNLPSDATVENTLFMEFSRSGKTEETVKIHEYTPRDAKRIVFANNGPLRELGLRDNNLVLRLPDEVSGRFGRNKTPILLAPMYVAGMDTQMFWKEIQRAIEVFDLADPDNLPLQIATFIYLHQRARGINHIYMACDDDLLLLLGDEFTQFWNEGVGKGENDILMSRYLGLPRDSHMNLEGILANHKTKMAFCLFSDTLAPESLHPMIRREIDPINPDHQGLCFGDEEKILAEANYARLSELMPCVKITLHGRPSLHHAAVVSQLWADITYCYSRLKNIDPGSNPEVKAVRDRSAALLARGAKALNSKC